MKFLADRRLLTRQALTVVLLLVPLALITSFYVVAGRQAERSAAPTRFATRTPNAGGLKKRHTVHAVNLNRRLSIQQE